MDFPKKIEVEKLVSSRYEDDTRPSDWDSRKPGIDTVIDKDGQEFRLASDGGQSPPKSGWVLMLQGGDAEHGFTWTLYGLKADAA